ncbi:ATPase [Erythrobacter sp.]|uniref:ATPase n=1 Tax=Erythrobacter sp. TaxID=1042 RepID=UPI0014260066|nr:ATPase [Erythrobacter sp.]QIQ86001.1 MAG: ATPase [Erythrobacter sp.]
MSGGHHIRSIGRGDKPRDTGDESVSAETDGEEGEAILLEDEAPDEDWSEAEAASDPADPGVSRFGWVAPALALLAIVGWTGFYLWALRGELSAGLAPAPSQWADWIIDWSAPVLLVGVAYLVAVRNSRAEAKRFAASAALLSRESAELEGRLAVVNRELSLAREFLASQSRELESLGRIASERISTHAGELQRLIVDNGAQVDAIGSASETALANMNRLRDDLPVIANSARDVTNQIGNAGRTAQGQLGELIAGFERLNEFGSATTNQVSGLGRKVAETLADFESQLAAIEQVAAGRFKALGEEAETYRASLDEAEREALSALRERVAALREESIAAAKELREGEDAALARLREAKAQVHDEIAETIATLEGLDRQAMDAARKRLAELHEEARRFDDRLEARDRRFMEEMRRRQDEFETRESQASEVLAQRLADLDEAMAQRREAQAEETEKLVAHGRDVGEQVERLGALIGEIAQASDRTREQLGSGLDELGQQLAERRRELAETESQLAELTEAGVRLLEIIQSGARHAREDLPRAIEGATGGLSSVEQRTQAVSALMLAAKENGGELSNYLIRTKDEIEATDASIRQLAERLEERSQETLARLGGLRGGFERLVEESERLGGETQDRVRAGLEELRAATEAAFRTLDEGARERLARLGEGMGAEAVEALDRALRSESAEAIGRIEQAAAHASGVGREAAAQLRDQLAKVNELAGNLEQRIARARELAEEKVNNDFARRMALITDSLNSASIDIASALSSEVADTAWDAYLKGDRGIFTRRAVRLVDSGDAKRIAELYQSDEDFKQAVARYIHDFEAMLRAMLSTRDGNALGVTVLGSDAGKLYVVLAQAIERFRD